ncbi:MAG TPA: uroporphyrinogen-III synthase [Rhodospirillales bacterium]|nr:uroporphyrinogen-III synthase [Rhodospirillales bacterium]
MIGSAPAVRRLNLWVTRPAEDAAEVAAALRAQGHTVLIEPLLVIERLDGPALDLGGVQALLATSANGVRAFAARQPERALPLLAVGDATARAARAAGFTQAESAAGDVVALAELARARLDPAAGPVLHVAAGDVAGNLAGALAAAGFDYRRAVLYRARTAEAVSDELTARIHDGRLDGVLVFSPRTAGTLVRLIREAGLDAAAGRLDLFALSAAVAGAAAALPWRRRIVAGQPTQAALLEAIAAVAAGVPAGGSGAATAAADSLSSRGDFAGTLPGNSKFTDVGTGGMISDDKNEQRPAESTSPAMKPPAADDAGAAGQPEAAAAPKSAAEPWGSAEPAAAAASGRAAAAASEPAAAATSGRAAAASGRVAASDPASPGEPPTPPPGRPPAAPAKAAAKGGAGPVVWALLALAVIAGGGAAAWFGYFQPRQQQQAEAPQVNPQQEVDSALDDLDAREARLRSQVAAMAPRLDALDRTVAELRQSVDELAARTQQGDTELTAQLAERIARLESQAANATSLAQQVRSLEVTTQAARDAASKLSTTVLGVGQLAQAVDGGGSFIRQLAAVRALGGDDAEIAQAAADLEPLAASGIPTLAALRAKFPETADAVARAEPVTAGGAWTDKVVDRLASLVSVRRTGPAAIAGGGVDGILARAETALAGGDLPTAVDALRGLTGAPAQAAADWLALARTRLEAERSLAILQQRAIARLSAAKG